MDWQYWTALALVLGAGFYLARHALRSLKGQEAGACHDCAAGQAAARKGKGTRPARR